MLLKRASKHYQTTCPPFSLNLAQTNDNVQLGWSSEPPGFGPEATADLISGPWAVVPGVTTNSVVLPISRTHSFFRLRWQWDGTLVR